ncbi:CheR family methyltransferase [Azospirillum canadense]|uniref:CheR family methyltransferase n=1 Tax=Azospirillum canadense TaxID=403962 RepID=UPI002226535A|nr:protein-glutamate O-methyltransferase [Azospirillum canadense]MCW2237988.1 chemotaxis protein methyltransferase CheR [Azospirillum canadense]
MTAATPASQNPAAPATTPAAAGRREFPFEKRHFEFIARMLHQLAGIALAPHKVEMVYSRLARRLRELNLADFDAYCALLEGEDGGNEIGFLVNALTTNLTSFFRESHHFDYLAKTVVPDIRGRHGGESSHPRLRIWSAGCSSGQEPYTIAMVLAAAFGPELRRWDAKILATDIDTHMIETARRGVYPAEVAASIPGALRDRFTRRLREDGEAKIAVDEELKRLITFKPLNLLEHWPMKGPFDAIFCRNVLIYFDRAGRTQVIENFARLLEPGGCLFLGHSESLYGVSNRFRQTGPTIYRRLP